MECFRQWYSLLYQFGGRFMDAAQHALPGRQRGGYAGLRVPARPGAGSRVAMPAEGSVDADFLAGKVSMYVQGPWYIHGALQAGIRLVTAPAPRIGARPLVWANSHVLGVVNTQDPRARRRRDALHRLDQRARAGVGRGRPGAGRQRGARATCPPRAIWPYLRPFAAQIAAIVYQPNLLVAIAAFAENLPTPVISATQAVMLGTATPAAAVSTMSAQVDQLVSGG